MLCGIHHVDKMVANRRRQFWPANRQISLYEAAAMVVSGIDRLTVMVDFFYSDKSL